MKYELTTVQRHTAMEGTDNGFTDTHLSVYPRKNYLIGVYHLIEQRTIENSFILRTICSI